MPSILSHRLFQIFRGDPDPFILPFGVEVFDGKIAAVAEGLEEGEEDWGHSQLDTTMQYAMVNQENVKTSRRKFIA